MAFQGKALLHFFMFVGSKRNKLKKIYNVDNPIERTLNNDIYLPDTNHIDSPERSPSDADDKHPLSLYGLDTCGDTETDPNTSPSSPATDAASWLLSSTVDRNTTFCDSLFGILTTYARLAFIN